MDVPVTFCSEPVGERADPIACVNNQIELTENLMESNANRTTSHNTHPDSISWVNKVNDDGVLDLSVSGPSALSTTPSSVSSYKSSSSGKSVEEILNSIVQYREKESSPDPGHNPEKRRKVRKQLKLPSVMTSRDWISLKQAQEEEKEEAEQKKEERRKVRELKQKTLQEAKKVAAKKKVEHVKVSELKKKVGNHLI